MTNDDLDLDLDFDYEINYSNLLDQTYNGIIRKLFDSFYYASTDDFFFERFKISEEEKAQIGKYEKQGIMELFKVSPDTNELNLTKFRI